MMETHGMKTIRGLRRERGWTQFELALAVGVQPQTIYLWESGRRLPQVPQVRKLGEVFGLCSDDIDLEPLVNRRRTTPRQARAGRHAGEPAPGRDVAGRAVTRGGEESAARHEEA
jgi:DNA-binding XRE family transcriptional regulator